MDVGALTVLNRRDWLKTAGAVASISGLAFAADAPITLQAFEPSGTPCPADRLRTITLADPDSRPYALQPRVTADGSVAIDLPPGKFEIAMVLPVTGFGNVLLYADNGGAFYPTPKRELLLNYEFAGSRAAFVRRYVKAAQAEGIGFSAALLSRLERGEAALQQAAAARETAARVAHSNDSLAETMWAGEMAVLERARQRIARQGPRPGFLFGCAGFSMAREEWASRFVDIFNYATLPFYRNNTERDEGKVDYSTVDAILTRLAGTKIVPKGHPLIWLKSSGMTEYFKKKSWPELKQSCREYILRSVGRYRDRIHAWDVINEAHDWAEELNSTSEQNLELTRLACETARIADPTVFRVINSCCTWSVSPTPANARSVHQYVCACRDAVIPFEAIGLQYYYPSRDMLEIERNLDRFLGFGKPVHITELGTSSSSNPVDRADRGQPTRNVWHGTQWTETIQADWAEQFYTICYSKPEVEAISWWSLSDPGFIPQSGLLTRENQPKESYERLRRLMGSWRT